MFHKFFQWTVIHKQQTTVCHDYIIKMFTPILNTEYNRRIVFWFRKLCFSSNLNEKSLPLRSLLSKSWKYGVRSYCITYFIFVSFRLYFSAILESRKIVWILSQSPFAEAKDKFESTHFTAWMVSVLSTCSSMDKLEDASLITKESSLANFANVYWPFWAFTCCIWNIPCSWISTWDLPPLSIRKLLLQTVQNAFDGSLVLLNHLTLSWRVPISYRNQSVEQFYMISASVMKELKSASQLLL